jgi:hypothetical protein
MAPWVACQGRLFFCQLDLLSISGRKIEFLDNILTKELSVPSPTNNNNK